MILVRDHAVFTTDGWRLSLQELKPSGGPRRPAPVLLLHGFGANGFVMWHQPGRSLGGHLAARGFSVWVLEFRGAGGAAERGFDRISVDDKIDHDLPAAIERVRRETGARAVDVVAHSLGGNILYAYLSQPSRAARVRRCVTMAAPLRYRFPLIARALVRLSPAGRPRTIIGRIPFRRFCRLGQLTNIVLPAQDSFNMANMDRAVLLDMMARGVADSSVAELWQLVRWSAGGAIARLDGSGDYRRGLGRVRAPILLLGGSADRNAPAASLREVAQLLGSRHKPLILIGKATGARQDYGHTDLLLGSRAETEVFVHIVRWLEGET